MRFLPLLVLLLLGGLGVSCAGSKPAAPAPAVSHRHREQSAADSDRWYATNFVGAYERIGRHDSKWDGLARMAIGLMADGRSGRNPSVSASQGGARELSRSAVERGCTDPLVRYAAVRYRQSDLQRADLELANALREVANDMEQSGYHPFHKLYATLRAAEALEVNLPKKDSVPDLASPEAQTVEAMYHRAFGHLLDALRDRDVPEEEIYLMSREFLQQMVLQPRRFTEFGEQLDHELQKLWPDSARANLARGWFQNTHAWLARGHGFAGSVTEEAGRLFASRSRAAEQALLQAWAEDPTEHRIPTAMIDICLNLGRSRPEMEQWFQRGMKVASNNYRACSAKLNYLRPSWYGSPEIMLEFGRECVRNTNWTGSVPLILMDAHSYLSSYGRSTEAEQHQYWLRPEVWPDLKSVYEEILRRFPNQPGWHHNYAWFAYQCEAWDDLNEQLRLLGPVNYEYFGGQAAFNRIVEDAKKHAKP